MPVEPESLADLFASLFGKPLAERIRAAREAMEQEAARLRDETSDADRLRACEQKVNYEVALREDAEAKRARAEGERDRFRNERGRYSDVTRSTAAILTAAGYECEVPGDLVTAVARMRADLQVAREGGRRDMEDVDYRLLREVREALGVDDARQMPEAARALYTASEQNRRDAEHLRRTLQAVGNVLDDAGVPDDDDTPGRVRKVLDAVAAQDRDRGQPGRDFAEMTERERHYARLITAVDDLLQTETDVRWVAAGLRTERG